MTARRRLRAGVTSLETTTRRVLFVMDFPAVTRTRRGLSKKEKTKRLAKPAQKLRRGSQNLKSRSRDTDHGPLGVIFQTLDSTRRGLANKEKTKCLASAVKSYGRDPDI